MKRIIPAICLALSAGLPAGASEESIYDRIKVDAGKAVYDAKCRRCHTDGSTDDSYGPPLKNIVGRAAGTYPDYDFSIALAASGIVWTPAALRAWMEDNDGFMPGTKMRHVGIQDPTVQDFVLSYLASITDRDGSAISD